jgi:hypothetical protein
VLSAFAREQWEWFSRRPESIQAEGRRRAEWARAIRQRVDLGETARAAIAAVSQETGVPVGTLRRIWWGDERHVGAAYVTPDVYAPVLAPRYAGREAVAEMSPEAWEALKADWRDTFGHPLCGLPLILLDTHFVGFLCGLQGRFAAVYGNQKGT